MVICLFCVSLLPKDILDWMSLKTFDRYHWEQNYIPNYILVYTLHFFPFLYLIFFTFPYFTCLYFTLLYFNLRYLNFLDLTSPNFLLIMFYFTLLICAFLHGMFCSELQKFWVTEGQVSSPIILLNSTPPPHNSPLTQSKGKWGVTPSLGIWSYLF